MPDPRPATRPSQVRRLAGLGGPLLILVLALGGAMAGCSSSPDGTGTPGAPAGAGTGTGTPPASADGPGSAMPEVPMGGMHMPTADEATATWKARPEYVKALPEAGQAAYAFALARPDVLQWLPCYCGCVGMGHRSNLDCFFQRREVSGSYVYEEHASFCDICVRTANLASQMLQQGSTMTQIRAAVDSALGAGGGNGTDTPLPPG